jgi:hypothetical protein
MSVIGRLDEQVNEILINPLSRRRSDEEEPAPPPAPEADPPPDENADKDETAEGHGELPVWML